MECLLAAGVKRQLKADAGNALTQLQKFIDQKNGWLFGHLGYDLKNEVETLSSSNPDNIKFPDLFFFEPAIIIRLSENELVIEADDPAAVFTEIFEAIEFAGSFQTPLVIQNRLSQQEYVAIVNELKRHILRGDCYEINFCQEFFAENVIINPIAVYRKLSAISPNPFSALYRIDDLWLLCASPERFIKRQGDQILSQPIKRTSIRIPNDERKDSKSKEDLKNSTKDRSENVMVVDLV